MWIFESGIASRWKASPNFVDSTAWEHHLNPDQTNLSINQPVADTLRSGISIETRSFSLMLLKSICTSMGYLLVNILLFSITIVIPVAEVSCLEYPHVKAQ